MISGLMALGDGIYIWVEEGTGVFSFFFIRKGDGSLRFIVRGDDEWR